MEVSLMNSADLKGFFKLAKEVEPYFGFSTRSKEFNDEVKKAIKYESAYVIRDTNWDELCAAMLISKEKNSIEFVTVAEKYRGMGMGSELLNFALSKLNSESDVIVITFDYPENFGRPARKLYEKAGFVKVDSIGVNPAGLKIMSMVKKGEAKDIFYEAFLNSDEDFELEL